jgi:hypothetical protein
MASEFCLMVVNLDFKFFKRKHRIIDLTVLRQVDVKDFDNHE